MISKPNIEFLDNANATAQEGRFISVRVDGMRVLESWRESLFSFEWLLPDGRIRALGDLPEHERSKREVVENKLKARTPIEKPILGIGLQENIEIGSGRAEFLTLIAHGLKEIPVHIPKACEKDFKAFVTAIDSLS
jgi:hypothetical protein